MGRVKQNFLKMKRCLLSALAVGLCLSVNVMAQVPSYVPSNGLVGWWPFNGNANDESGNGNNGTVNGATLTADRFCNFNSAYSFDGNLNHIKVISSNSSIEISGDFTFSLWANISFHGSIRQHLLVKGDNSTNEFSLNCREDQTLHFDKQGLQTLSNFPYSSYYDVWTNIVCVLNNNSAKLYVNGNFISSTPLNSPINPSSLPLIFGTFYDNLTQLPNPAYSTLGILDDIGMWNRALTQQEIDSLYNWTDYQSNNLTISPQNNYLTIGSNASFSIASSNQSQTFIWQSDFGQGFQTLNNYGNYSGATTNSLTISNVQLSNHNQQIRAISTSGNCIDTSNIATIQIADTCITNVTVYDTLLTTVTDTLIINTTLSLPAPNNENTILIYPNPASDHITISNGNYTAMAGYTIKIENNAGQQVFQSLINQAQFYVDLSTWSGNGLYFVHLIDAQGNTVTVRKIVLQ